MDVTSWLTDLALRGGLPTEGAAPVERRISWSELCATARALDPFEREPGDLLGLRRDDRLDAALVRVHRSEQARLLVEATDLALEEALGEEGEVAHWLLGGAPTEYVHWRERALEELSLTRADRLTAPLALLVGSLWHPGLWGGDGAAALAAASLALERGSAGHLALARAHLAGGEPESALEQVHAARRDLDPELTAAARELERALERSRAAALEARGDLGATLAAVTRVLLLGEDANGRDRARLGSLALALALLLDDPAAVRRAAGGLSHATPPPELAEVLRSRLPFWLDRLGRDATAPLERRAVGEARRLAASAAEAPATVAALILSAPLPR